MLDIYNSILVNKELVDEVDQLEIVGNVHFQDKFKGCEGTVDRDGCFV